MFRLYNNQRGFTLIELLVVIAIIGMLSSVVLASLTTARLKSRDARRLADIKQIQAALELYNNDNQKYPASPTDTTVENLSGVLTPNYISNLPSDPKYTGSNGYRYAQGASRQGYTLLVNLEKDSTTWCKIVEYPGASGWSDDITYPSCF